MKRESKGTKEVAWVSSSSLSAVEDERLWRLQSCCAESS